MEAPTIVFVLRVDWLMMRWDVDVVVGQLLAAEILSIG